MEQTIITVYRQLVQRTHCSADDILETPELREQYLTETRQLLGNLPEQQLLHALTSLRRRCKLPRSRELVKSSDN